jgi:hypothetical protein
VYLGQQSVGTKPRRFPVMLNRINGVMVTVLDSSAVDRVFESRTSQTKDYRIGICCFSSKNVALRRKSIDYIMYTDIV